MIQQGPCSTLCCNTVLTVTEGHDGNYCINSFARCFLGWADRVVWGRCNLYSCAGQIKPSAPALSSSAEAGDNTLSHSAGCPGLFPNVQSLLLKSFCVCFIRHVLSSSPKAICPSQPLNFFCIDIDYGQGFRICKGLI